MNMNSKWQQSEEIGVCNVRACIRAERSEEFQEDSTISDKGTFRYPEVLDVCYVPTVVR